MLWRGDVAPGTAQGLELDTRSRSLMVLVHPLLSHSHGPFAPQIPVRLRCLPTHSGLSLPASCQVA